MRIPVLFAFVAALLGLGGFAAAHGPQVQITFNPTTGRIETRQIVDTGSAPTTISNLTTTYVMPLLPFTDGGSYVRPDQSINIGTGLPNFSSSPGLAWQYEANLAGTGWTFGTAGTGQRDLTNSQFQLNIQPGVGFWNGSAFVDPGTEQFQAFTGPPANPTATATSQDAGGSVASLGIGQITATSGNPHTTVRWRVLGNGSTVNSPSDDGVYLLNLTVSSSAAGVGESDQFRFLLYKNASQGEIDAALLSFGLTTASAGVQFFPVVPVPEPAWGLVAGAAVLAGTLAYRIRRRRAA
jgi:hypothetical protein